MDGTEGQEENQLKEEGKRRRRPDAMSSIGAILLSLMTLPVGMRAEDTTDVVNAIDTRNTMCALFTQMCAVI